MIQTIIGNEFPKKVIPLIETAQKKIDIIIFDWRWYADQIGYSIQKFNQALIQKAKQNVEIRAILQTEQTKRTLDQNGIKTKRNTLGRMLHTKLMLIDDEIVIIGSHNYSYNAFEMNLETSVIIYDKEVNAKFTDYFSKLWQ